MRNGLTTGRGLSLAAAGVAAMALTLTACGSGGIDDEGGGGEDTLTIGFVSTETGSSAPFGEANSFVVDEMEAYFKDHPVKVGDKELDVEIVVRDAQSDTTKAGAVAGDLINKDGADIIVASSTTRSRSSARPTRSRASPRSPRGSRSRSVAATSRPS